MSDFDPKTVNLGNVQMVGAAGRHITVSAPSHAMTTSEAVVHAAWLVAIARTNGVTKEQFDEVLARVLAI